MKVWTFGDDYRFIWILFFFFLSNMDGYCLQLQQMTLRLYSWWDLCPSKNKLSKLTNGLIPDNMFIFSYHACILMQFGVHGGTDTAGTKLGQGSSTEQYIASPLMAEAIAIREAPLHAKTPQFTKICIKAYNTFTSKIHLMEIYGLNLDSETLSSFFFLFCTSFSFFVAWTLLLIL